MIPLHDNRTDESSNALGNALMMTHHSRDIRDKIKINAESTVNNKNATLCAKIV